MKSSLPIKKAFFVRDLEGFRGHASLYRLDPPLNNREFVIVSAVNVYGEPETYIFPAYESGEILNWSEMKGSTKGILSHEKALYNAGGYLIERN